MIDTHPYFSILTPTWNRADYLYRVFDGLLAQTNRSFEWIVGDDGSTDDTDLIIRSFAKKADFPIIYIRANKHVGKARMDNEALRLARGELVLWCDSDDWLTPNALERLWQAWTSIPLDQRDNFVGLTALAATEQGIISDPSLGEGYKDVSWNDLAQVHQVKGDMLFCARADLLKGHPFPEVDLVIPESVVWTAIGHKPARLISEVLKMVEYKADHGISFSGTMSYNRGRAYALATTVRNLKQYKISWKRRVWQLITFIRYSIHGEISLRNARSLWGNNHSSTIFWLALPVVALLALKDSMQGKVHSSHREFLANKDAAIISIDILK